MSSIQGTHGLCFSPVCNSTSVVRFIGIGLCTVFCGSS